MTNTSRPAGRRGTAPGQVVIGAYLRQLRKNRGLCLEDVASRVTCTVALIDRTECAQAPPQLALVLRLLQEYGVEKPQEVGAIYMLLDPDGVHLDPHSARARDRLASCWRAAAGSVRTYAHRWLPPAVHTPAYARAYADIHSTSLHGPTSGIPFPEPSRGRPLTLIVDEDILDRPVGGRAAMAEQIDRLQRLVEERSLRVRVIPPDRPIPFIRTPVTQLDPFGYPLDVEDSGAGMRYSAGSGIRAALDRVEEAAYRLGAGYDRLEAARLAFAGGRS